MVSFLSPPSPPNGSSTILSKEEEERMERKARVHLSARIRVEEGGRCISRGVDLESPSPWEPRRGERPWHPETINPSILFCPGWGRYLLWFDLFYLLMYPLSANEKKKELVDPKVFRPNNSFV
ncbi:hypothetical protein TNCT_603311 [Trichonephila clavata]|uniref:Uncharacterized protein n=1 Tax=Trichonephila clavata TaxID=2740835 RepID=A0A8X6L093_TRICU|nr:hypothetical protein TNCT_603311 [Trichonephila clavata]